MIWKLNKCLIFLKFHPKFDKSREFWYFLCFVALVFISIVYTVPKNHLFWNNVGKVSFKRQLGLLEVYPRTISDNLLILSTFDLKTNTEHNVQSQKQTMRTTKNDRQINWTKCWLSNLCWDSIFYVNRSNCAQPKANKGTPNSPFPSSINGFSEWVNTKWLCNLKWVRMKQMTSTIWPFLWDAMELLFNRRHYEMFAMVWF